MLRSSIHAILQILAAIGGAYISYHLVYESVVALPGWTELDVMAVVSGGIGTVFCVWYCLRRKGPKGTAPLWLFVPAGICFSIVAISAMSAKTDLVNGVIAARYGGIDEKLLVDASLMLRQQTLAVLWGAVGFLQVMLAFTSVGGGLSGGHKGRWYAGTPLMFGIVASVVFILWFGFSHEIIWWRVHGEDFSVLGGLVMPFRNWFCRIAVFFILVSAGVVQKPWAMAGKNGGVHVRNLAGAMGAALGLFFSLSIFMVSYQAFRAVDSSDLERIFRGSETRFFTLTDWDVVYFLMRTTFIGFVPTGMILFFGALYPFRRHYRVVLKKVGVVIGMIAIAVIPVFHVGDAVSEAIGPNYDDECSNLEQLTQLIGREHLTRPIHSKFRDWSIREDDQFLLPISTSDEYPDSDAPLITVTRKELRVGSSVAARLEGGRWTESEELRIDGLDDALEEWRSRHPDSPWGRSAKTARIAFDKHTPYKTVASVLYTVQGVEFERIQVLTRQMDPDPGDGRHPFSDYDRRCREASIPVDFKSWYWLCRAEGYCRITEPVFVKDGMVMNARDGRREGYRISCDYRSCQDQYLHSIEKAAERFMEKNPEICPTVGNLKSHLYLFATVPSEDKWGREFVIECCESTVVAYSLGPDGIKNTIDDIDMLSTGRNVHKRCR